MQSSVNCYVIAREGNVVRVDFRRTPDPPSPCFPGANGLRLSWAEHQSSDSSVYRPAIARSERNYIFCEALKLRTRSSKSARG
jgi:hypothetical protein